MVVAFIFLLGPVMVIFSRESHVKAETRDDILNSSLRFNYTL